MTNFQRLTSLAATVAALAVTATPASAASLVSASPQAVAKVKVLRALTLTRKADLDFGTIVLSGTGTWSGEVVTVNSSGALTACGTTNLTCSAPATGYSAAKYNVTGSNNSVVALTVPATVSMSNGAGGTISVNLAGAPTSLTLTSSGSPGDDFSFGGSITLASSTADGSYTGTIAVTADYQ
jgi:hypothetical protein